MTDKLNTNNEVASTVNPGGDNSTLWCDNPMVGDINSKTTHSRNIFNKKTTGLQKG